MGRPRLAIFASGTEIEGGSGARGLVVASQKGVLLADIAVVVSNHATGGVCQMADQLGVPFVHFTKPRTAERHQAIIRQYSADFVALSGCLWLVEGLNPRQLSTFIRVRYRDLVAKECMVAMFMRPYLPLTRGAKLPVRR